MIELKFTGTPEDVLSQMKTFFGTVIVAAGKAAPAVSEVSSDKPQPEAQAAEPAPARGRGRPKKAAPEAPAEAPQISANPENREPAPEPEEQPEPQPEAAKAAPSVDDVRKVVSEYVNKWKIDVARGDIAKLMAADAPGVANIGALGGAPDEVRTKIHAALTAAVAAGTRLPGSEG